jgi:hypothetical protein
MNPMRPELPEHLRRKRDRGYKRAVELLRKKEEEAKASEGLPPLLSALRRRKGVWAMSDSLKLEIAAIRKREAELNRVTGKCLAEFRRELRNVLAYEARRADYETRPYEWKSLPGFGQGYGIYSRSGALVGTVESAHEAARIVYRALLPWWSGEERGLPMIKNQLSELTVLVQKFLAHRNHMCGKSQAEIDAFRAFLDWAEEREEPLAKTPALAPGEAIIATRLENRPCRD